MCQPIEKVLPTELGRSTFQYVDIGSVDPSALSVVGAVETEVDAAPSRARQLLRHGDTVFSTVRPYLRKIAWIPEEFDGEIASTGFCVLRAGEAINCRFLFHLVSSSAFISRVVEKQRGVSYPAVRERDVLEIEVPVPPLTEQRRIVAKLDEQLANIETGEVALGDARARIVDFVASLLADATKPSSEVSNWESKTIGEMAAVSSGATPLKGRSDYYDGGTVPWVTSSLLNAPFVDRAEKFITDRAVAETAVKQYPPGTLLLAMYGEGRTRGKCSELRIRATTNQACAGIQLAAEYECRKDWVKLVLEARYEENRALASGGVQPNLSLGLVKKIQVPLPPLVRQREILEQVAQRRADAGEMADVIESVKVQAAELRNALLHAAFTGTLVPQAPDDEPASVLLDRIRVQRAADAKPTRRKRVSGAASLAAPRAPGRPVPSGTQEALPL
ncbi:restriction endonuclease subunit S [Streptomyces sp. 2224.1]|uniref:restriction endonuclease subunit S n=1 Tax=Streptomyces sp. 2224.1 TaxID=1881020 RepID=UPI0015A3804D|nr:restriction endonuclease subunit S [Streptomyces sp. 2224.1]